MIWSGFNVMQGEEKINTASHKTNRLSHKTAFSKKKKKKNTRFLNLFLDHNDIDSPWSQPNLYGGNFLLTRWNTSRVMKTAI